LAEAGYSGTPLPKKLGLQAGQRVLFLDLPDTQRDLTRSCDFAESRKADWTELPASGGGWDVIHGFTTRRVVLEDNAQPLMDAITRDGMVWISWPKKASKVETDITEDTLREICLPIGLVDVKVCAVDDIWSGLKLVIRKELR
jgi:hypothetical protein